MRPGATVTTPSNYSTPLSTDRPLSLGVNISSLEEDYTPNILYYRAPRICINIVQRGLPYSKDIIFILL